MLIINGGIPRSGTVLIGNMVRLMLENRGIPWARYNPQERRDMPAFLDVVQTAPSKPALIVHTHLITPDIAEAIVARQDAVLLWNHRDPRDALVSLAKLHDLDLPNAIRAIRIYAQAGEIALNTQGCIQIRYDALTASPTDHIDRLARALGLQLAPTEADELNAQTSLRAHGAVMGLLRDGSLPNARTLKTMRRSMREDSTTLINDRHIQSGKNGRWRAELTENQQTRVQDALAHWINAFGYALP